MCGRWVAVDGESAVGSIAQVCTFDIIRSPGHVSEISNTGPRLRSYCRRTQPKEKLMTDSLSTWTAHADPFSAVVASVTDWHAPSPCEGWTARDVLQHVIDTEREFLAGRGHRLPDVESDNPGERWRTHEEAVRELLSEPSVGEETYDGYFGPTTVGETLAQFYGFDLLVHRWDLAASQGDRTVLTDTELDEIDSAVTGWGEHAYAPGVFARPVDVPADADRQAKVLARTGRDVHHVSRGGSVA
jgi:uncharacterized protein (TIGR03086 family)